MMSPSTGHRASRKSSGFNPAIRVGQNETGEKQYSLATNEAPEYTPPARDDIETLRPNVVDGAEHLTKTGKIDRRFKGFRDLPKEEEEVNPDYIHPTTAVVNEEGIHVSPKTGKPDRRFAENRGLSEEEINRKWAEAMAKEYGLIDGE